MDLLPQPVDERAVKGDPASTSYVIVTAARNEEKYIRKTIEAVVSQEVRPTKWVIISDGSTDGTDEIISEYAAQYPWIIGGRRVKADQNTDFASKVYALNQGLRLLDEGSHLYIGILDADVTFEGNYYKSIISRFQNNPRLGIAGGYIYEEYRGQFASRPTNSQATVAGAIQLFRRSCFEGVGGHRPLPFGGEDTVSEIIARMNGWEVRSFPDLIVCHHNIGAYKRGRIRNAIRQGRMDYSVGTDPLFEVFKCARRMTTKPYVLGGIVRIFGFLRCYLWKDKRMITDDVVKFTRREQRERLARIIRGNS